MSSIDIVLWAIAQRHEITPDRIRARWGVHYATSYRWAAPLEEARKRAQNMVLPTADSHRRPVAMPALELRA